MDCRCASCEQLRQWRAAVADFEGAAGFGDDLLIERQAHRVSNGGVEVGDRDRVFVRAEGVFVGSAPGSTPLDASAGEQAAEDAGMMVSTAVLIDLRRASELGAQRDQRRLQQTFLTEVLDQSCECLVENPRSRWKPLRVEDVDVLIPTVEADFDEPHVMLDQAPCQ